MATIPEPRFRHLTLEESHALLASNSVGRIAFSLHDRVDMQPINYISDGDWIFGRTSEGTKLALASRSRQLLDRRPAPHRNVVFGINAHEISGRTAHS